MSKAKQSRLVYTNGGLGPAGPLSASCSRWVHGWYYPVPMSAVTRASNRSAMIERRRRVPVRMRYGDPWHDLTAGAESKQVCAGWSIAVQNTC